MHFMVDGVRYKLWTPQDEREDFQPIVKLLSKEIFGEDTLYFDVELKLESLGGKSAKPEGFVLDLKRNNWYVVEVELSKHNPYDHIANQLMRFVNGIDNLKTKNYIVESLYRKIQKDKLLRIKLEEKVGGEVHHWLSKLISNPPRIVVIIEEKTQEVLEACKILRKSFETHIRELKTFAREDAETVRAYLVEPLQISKAVAKEMRRDGREDKRRDYEKVFEERLKWADDNVKQIVGTLVDAITGTLKDVTHWAQGRYYLFYRGKPSTKSVFGAILLTKKFVNFRIRTDPSTFKDPVGTVKERKYRGWFFKTGEEREFRITDRSQIGYALTLIKQSYDLAK